LHNAYCIKATVRTTVNQIVVCGGLVEPGLSEIHDSVVAMIALI